MPSCQLETCMHYATCFHDRQVLTDMLLQVRYSCGEGGQEAILSIKVRLLVAALPIALVCGLTSWPLLLAFTASSLLVIRRKS